MNQSKIPEGWEEATIEQLSNKIQSGGTPTSTNEKYYEGDIPFVIIEDITSQGKYLKDTIKHINNKAIASCSTWKVPPGKILYTMYATLGDVSINKAEVCTNQAILVIFPNNHRIDTEYLYYVLLWYKQFVYRHTAQTTQSNLNAGIVKKFLLRIPKSFKEQQKIAHILLTIDNTIDKTKGLIEKNKMMKQGLIQDLFKYGSKSKKLKNVSINKKVHDVPDNWKVKSIARTSILKGRIGWQGLTTKEYLKDGDYFLVTGTDFQNGKINWETCAYVDAKRYFQDRNIQLKIGDILITKDGTIGKVAFIDKLRKEGTLNSGVFVLRPRNVEYIPKFLYYVLMSFVFDRFIENLKAGSTIAHLYQKDFVNFEFPVPEDEGEQKYISQIFDKINEKIESEESYLQKLLKIKAGLMQDLLTGKVRVAA